MLQTVNADLLERNARLEAENRCGFCRRGSKGGAAAPPLPPLSPPTGVVASIKAKLASKPVFAGHLVVRSTTNASLQGSSSCSQLSSHSSSGSSSSSSSSNGTSHKKLPSLSGESGAEPSQPQPVKVLSHVERLKKAFLSGGSLSSTPAAAQSRPYSRSVSCNFPSSSAGTPAQARKWVDSESETKESDHRTIPPIVVRSKMEPQSASGQEPPPPPVDAVVITRESSPRDETDSGYRADSVHYESSSPRYSPDELIDRYSKMNAIQRTPPDDSIEIDASFRAIVRGSVDSESVSVSSFSIISSDRSFERSESLLLTPRSTLNSETSSRKSFGGKSLKKRKMFKGVANAMFSLCGP